MATCYSEGAIKVTDAGRRRRSVSSSVPAYKKAVRCLYRVKLSSEEQFLIKITWCGVAARGFWISVCDYPCSSSNKNYCSRQIQKAKGSVPIQGCRAMRSSEVFWDLTNASYGAGPEPLAGFCILVLINSEIVLFLGDDDQELASQKCSSGLKVAGFTLVSRCEYFSAAAASGGGGGAGFSTKARFCDSGTSHDILIRCTGEEKGARSSTLSVTIDERNVIVVPRLQWNFRGNQTIFVDGLLVDMMWDAHEWMFNQKSGGAVFMFRTRSGLDSRLWLAEKNLEQKEQENLGFSFLICACKNPS
ncbi:PREDICTED: uncharacterized protein LOC109181102 [Ipomoea nil]|uniref:uncharacterized protein LOC109181102 n=1 Tax=Ipomoea nil TaxID=35883 RepID=UPI000900B17A|nr:PREDICTED: uncharacterized protein LOC109181102 [Ipomoea nil]